MAVKPVQISALLWKYLSLENVQKLEILIPYEVEK